MFAATSGQIAEHAGAGWTPRIAPDTSASFNGIWAASEQEVFLVGETPPPIRGLAYRYLAGQWQELPLPQGTPRLLAVWGASAQRVFAVGDAGTVLQFDGTSWTTMPTDASINFKDVSGAARDAFAVGQNGAIWRISR